MSANTTNNHAQSTTPQTTSRSHIILTVTHLTWLERCKRRLWLDVHGDQAARVEETPVAHLLATQGQRHEGATLEATHGPAEQLVVHSWQEHVQQTLELIRQGASEIRQAALDCEIISGVRLCGLIDALVRVDVPSAFGAWSYEPVEIKLHGDVTPTDRLQLDLYRGMLSILQGTLPAGQLWLGAGSDGTPARRLRVAHTIHTPSSYWQHLVELLAVGEAPPIWFAKHCSYCPWRDACTQTGLAEGDLAILPYLHPSTATELRNDGTTSVHQVAAMHPQNLQRYPYVGKQGARLHAAATAISQGKPVHLPQPPQSLPYQASISTAGANNEPIFFDLETHRYEPWGFGFATRADDLRIVLVRPARMRRSQQIINGVSVDFVPSALAGWQLFLEAVQQTNAPIIHWSQHEVKCLESSANWEIQQALAGRLFDAYGWMKERVILPIPRLPTEPAAGIKMISRYLGIAREEGLEHWAGAESAYLSWYHSSHRGRTKTEANMLDPVVAYLRADVLGLAHIWHWLDTQFSSV